MLARILSSGDTALVVEFGNTANNQLSSMVLGLDKRLAEAKITGVVETVPTLRSLMIHYDPNLISHDNLSEAVAPLVDAPDEDLSGGRRHMIPTCYEGDFAPDLADVAAATGLTQDRVIELHAAVTYRVYAIGFLPGCPYMGDIAEELRLPRRTSPRTNVPAGAVAIATTMTNIYPLESPGGWHLIGRTPIKLFDLTRPAPMLLAPADEVVFQPVSRAEFDRLAASGASV